MSTTYSVIAGDTFSTIARKTYGDDQQASLISGANPGVLQPLVVGTTLVIPDQPGAPQDLPQRQSADSASEVSISINNQVFRFWNEVRIVRSIDTLDTVEFSAPFEPESEDFRNNFKPFNYAAVDITVGGDQLFKGTEIGVSPQLENERRTVTVSAYSLPGVLNDCTPSAATFEAAGGALEYSGQGLREIAISLARPFGIDVDFLEDQGAVFERVSLEPARKILPFLTELAKQRNLIISSSPSGQLTFLRSAQATTPVTRLQEGASPLLSAIPFFTQQEYYSHITGIEPVILGLAGSQYTVKNPRLPNVVRPFIFNTPDSYQGDVKSAVEAKAGRMFGSMVSYTVTVNTWRTESGSLWEPNTTVQLNAPGAMVYSDFDFIIRSVEFNRNARSETAVLNLVLPGSFSGEVPARLPWEE